MILGAAIGLENSRSFPASLPGDLGIKYFRESIKQRVSETLRDVERSPSQAGQDLFVLMHSGFKRNGFFVEFGAADGIRHSNTQLLEEAYGWRGILAEPARYAHSALSTNRNCVIDKRCVWHSTGEQLEFSETESNQLSTISTFVDADSHSAARKKARKYSVDTVSLMDLLIEHDAPKHIDYLSVDTEGSEFEILKAFDFSAYDVAIITCEHNFTPQRERIHALLSAAGYERKFQKLSMMDDWYIKAKN